MRIMRRHLNTLYVTSEGSRLRKDGENAVVNVDGSEVGRVPIHLLAGIVCFGPASVTPPLLGHCAEKGICISLLSRSGRFRARVEGPVSGNVLLRRGQYRASDNPESTVAIARNVVTGKVLNQRTVVRRALRDHGEHTSGDTCARLKTCEQHLTSVARRSHLQQSTDAVRGIEGEAARRYFGVFDDLVLNQEPAFQFTKRSRRPPLDPINSLLSFLYTLLVHDCRSALETVGLDPAVGFLHCERPGRPSLALDLMEELRPVLADRLALSMINRRQVSPDDFEESASGAVSFCEALRKRVLTAYQERKRDEIMHPFLKEKTTLGLIPFIQATLMARLLRGELDGYPPFIWR